MHDSVVLMPILCVVAHCFGGFSYNQTLHADLTVDKNVLTVSLKDFLMITKKIN